MDNCSFSNNIAFSNDGSGVLFKNSYNIIMSNILF